MNEKEKELMLENIKLIRYVISKERFKYKNEEEFQDIYYAGLFGLIKGCEKYDSKLGAPSTFLTKTIKLNILQMFYLKSMNKRKIHNDTLASLDKELDDGGVTLKDLLVDKETNVEEEIIRLDEIESVRTAISMLKNEKDIYLIRNYYGIETTPKTLETLGAELGCSRGNISAKLSHIRKELKIILQERFGFNEERKKDD